MLPPLPGECGAVELPGELPVAGGEHESMSVCECDSEKI